ncbi:MAG: hypothetical protein KF830_03970 [Planctomycetes bacterium]|nr:hypothetical protein [Planctomycetota bacterium]
MSPAPWWRPGWPLLVAVALQLGVQAGQLLLTLRATGGELAYPLDDAYIHLAMARTLAEHGVFGITPHAVAASSSSPLWLGLLAAGAWALGSAVWLPLALATAAALALVVAVDRGWRRHGLAAGWRAAGLGALVLLVPLPTLASTGMEHALHALLALGFVAALTAALDEPARGGLRRALLLAPLLAAARLESAFLIAPAVWLVGRRRGLWPALALGAAAAAPWLLLGGWSWSQGQFFLPNSIVLKSGHVAIPGLSPADHGWSTGVRALARHGHAGVLFVLLAFAAWRSRGPAAARLRPALAVALVGLLLHAQLARFGWFFRYEAYLLVLGFASALPALHGAATGLRPRGRRALALFAVAGLAAFVPRASRALRDPPRASRHTFLQNVQVARVLAAHGGGAAVAVNDIGAVSYLGRVRTVDLVGLADVEVARARLAGAFDAAFVRRLTAARGCTLAVVYEDWFPGQLPPEWTRLARWTVPQPYWGATVSWFVIEPSAAGSWRAALDAAGEALPGGVLRD